VFSEREVKTHSYLYSLENAYIKVTSKDNESIDSLTVMGLDSSFSLEYLVLPDGIKAGKYGERIITSELIEACNHSFIQTMRDVSFVLEYYTSAPHYLHYTFFGPPDPGAHEYLETKDPNLFIGGTINGICVSASTEDIYYIYDSEMR
jgi:hypothetical protein